MRVTPNIQLSEMQKKVLAIVASAPTPQVALEELQKQPEEIRNNVIEAKETLKKLGMLAEVNGAIEITPKGEETMRDAYLINEFGELTEEGQKYIEGSSGNVEAKNQAERQTEMQPFESFSLIREINDSVTKLSE